MAALEPAQAPALTLPSGADAAREVAALPDASSTRTPAAPTAASLVVRVLREGTEEPVPGLALVLHEERGAWGFRPTEASHGGPVSLRTDASGRAEFDVLPGLVYGLEVNRSADGPVEADIQSWREWLEPLLPGERREHVVTVSVGLDLVWCGRIVDGESLLPLAGARGARLFDISRKVGQESTRSAGDGLVELRFASWRTGYARIELEGYAPGFVGLKRGHEDPATALTVKLLRAATLELLVTDPHGAPRAGVEAIASIGAAGLVQGPVDVSLLSIDHEIIARTDADGRCVLEGLPARDALTLELRAEGQSLRLEEAVVRLEPGERRALTWTVGGTCQLLGQTVEADGRPAAGVRVWAVPYTGMQVLQRSDASSALETRSDALGNFELELAAGDWLVGPAPVESVEGDVPEDSGIAAIGTSLRIEPGQASVELRLTCWRGLYLTGRVLGPDREVIQSGFVSAIGAGGWFDDNFRRGAFSLGPVPPGEYVLIAQAHSDDLASSKAVTFEAGERDIELVLRRGARLSVRVLDSQGRAADGAVVWVLAPGDGAGTFTRADGLASFGSVSPGTYALSASSEAGEFALLRMITLAEGDSRELELRLAPAARLRLDILPRAELGMNVEILQDGLLISLAVLVEGSAVALPPGEYELVLKGPGGFGGKELQRQRVHVAAEGETRAVFDLEAR